MAQPGWYPDPGDGRQQRWWDGVQWTSHVQAGPYLPPPPAMWTPAPPSLSTELDSELRVGRMASAWLWAGAALYAVQFLASALMLSYLFQDFFDDAFGELDRMNRAGTTGRMGTSGTFGNDPLFTVLSLLSNLLQVGVLAIGVLFAVWLYNSAKLARRIGLPATLQPYWAVLGFVVPIVNWWFPYQVARDCLPAGHPGRRDVGLWWALWLLTSFAGIPILVVSLTSRPGAVFLALVAGLIGCATVVKARDVIAHIGACHTELVEQTAA